MSLLTLDSRTLSLLPAALLLSTGPAFAGTATTQMVVTAVSLRSCIAAALPMSFGTLSQLTGDANETTAALTITCTPGTGYSVALDNGIHADSGKRRMKEALASNYVEYQLFSDAARQNAWGTAPDVVSRTAGLLPDILTVYGRVPDDIPAAPIGAYADTVTVTVTF